MFACCRSAVEFDNVTLSASRLIPAASFLHELLLLDYTLVKPTADLAEAGFVLMVGRREMGVTALGRFQPPGATGHHALRIVDSVSKTSVCSCTTGAAASTADLLGFVNCDLNTSVMLLAGRKYYVVSEEAGGSGYFAVTAPGWSISSGFQSLISYDRSWAAVAGGVRRTVAEDWVEALGTDQMTVALNLHTAAV